MTIRRSRLTPMQHSAPTPAARLRRLPPPRSPRLTVTTLTAAEGRCFLSLSLSRLTCRPALDPARLFPIACLSPSVCIISSGVFVSYYDSEITGYITHCNFSLVFFSCLCEEEAEEEEESRGGRSESYIASRIKTTACC